MTHYADALAALFAVSLFLLFFYGPWQGILVDLARQTVFEQRDAVFDMAAAGKLDFNSRDYRIIRDSFNKLIRFAHELNWMRLVLHGLGGHEKVPDVQQAIDRIEDAETRKDVIRHLQRARFAMIAMIGSRSLFLLVAAIMIGVVTWCMGTTRDLFRRLDATYGETIQCEAEGA
jgi:hypothetical protein